MTTWNATLLVEGEDTPDGRSCAPGSISWEEPLRLSSLTGEQIGKVEPVWREGNLIRGIIHADVPDDLSGAPVAADVRIMRGKVTGTPDDIRQVITSGQLMGATLVPAAVWPAARIDGAAE